MAELTLSDRLKEGAKILGEMWRHSVRCVDGWAVLCEDCDPKKPTVCSCDHKSKFCKARDLWVKLALQAGRPVEQTPIGLLEMMTGTEWEKAAVVVTFDLGDKGIIPVGPKTHPRTKIDIRSMGRLDPETIGPMLTVLSVFGGSQVERVEEEQPVAAPETAPTEGIGVE